jgi:hypothetical protein
VAARVVGVGGGAGACAGQQNHPQSQQNLHIPRDLAQYTPWTLTGKISPCLRGWSEECRAIHIRREPEGMELSERGQSGLFQGAEGGGVQG